MDNKTYFEKLVQNIKVAKRGSEISPHKYILLLSISELFEINQTQANIFTYQQLEPIYLGIFNEHYKSMPDYRKTMDHPFYHLKNDGFWFLKPKFGREELYHSYQQKRLTRKRIIETIDYAYLDDEVFIKLKDPTLRKLFKNEIYRFIKKNQLEYKMPSENNFLKEHVSLYKHEQDAINEIIKNVKNNDIGGLIGNVLLYDKQTNNYFEIDALLATGFGIFVIELKHWTGHIRVEPYNWLVNDTNYRSDPRKVNNFKAKIVKGLYQHHFKTYPSLWVESVIVFTNPDATIDGANSPRVVVERGMNNPVFASIGDLITYLRKKKSMTDNPTLDDGQVASVVNYFSSLNQPKQSMKYSVYGYETIEYISQRAECIEIIARPKQGFGRGLYRFRIFRIPYYATHIEKERFKKKAQNTIQVVSRIGDHPYIHKVWLVPSEVGDIIEGSDWSETGTLKDLIYKRQGKFITERALQICRDIADALGEAHKNGIIHRAVKPENVFMLNDVPKLSNFDLAYELEDSRFTVIEDPTELKDDGYIAPELIYGGDIDEGTDFFSLGVIAYELLVGEKPFASTRQYVAHDEQRRKELEKKLRKCNTDAKVVNVIMGMLDVDRKSRVSNVKKILNVFNPNKDMDGRVLHIANKELEPGSSHDVYEITELIGKGDESQIYKARGPMGIPVAIKLFNREVPPERVFKEAEITSAVNSSYVVGCENRVGHWNKDRYFIVFEYIPGRTLRDIIAKSERPDLDTFKTIALGLMRAVEAFHAHKDDDGKPKPYLHSDIKPENIMITEDKKGILIDCGISGEPRVDTFKGSVEYIPPDSLSGTDMVFSNDGDLFALGVTLWEWLIGSLPYDKPSIGESVSIPQELKQYIPDNLKDWLIKAVSTEAKNRFDSIKEMKNAFVAEQKYEQEKGFEIDPNGNDDISIEKSESGSKNDDGQEVHKLLEDDKEAHGNSFVAYLRSLSNASAGNENSTAEAQFLNDYFSCIEVENPINEYIFEELTSGRCNLILTGNAGDGKTTIAMDVYKRLGGKRKQLRKRELMEDVGLTIIKDMSELETEERQLILEEAMATDKSFLIVSNTGTLLESFDRLEGGKFRSGRSELLKAFDADIPRKILDRRFLVVNIGRLDSINIACKVFERMLEESNWEVCKDCADLSNCPIFANIDLLREGLDVVSERVKLIYRKLFEYNVRLTMRHMVGHLAYSITGGLGCQDVKQMSMLAKEKQLSYYLFFNQFFGDDGENVSPNARQLYAIRQIINAHFGTVLDATFERKAWMKDDAIGEELGDSRVLHNIFRNIKSRTKPVFRKMLRRFVYFFVSTADDKRYLSTYLGSPMLFEYTGLLEGVNVIPRAVERKLRLQILQVMQEYFIGMKLPEGKGFAEDLYITARQDHGGSGTQMVLARFPISDFQIVVDNFYSIGGVQKKMLRLKYTKGLPKIDLDLPFLDYVSQHYEGVVTEELSAYYTDRLERFKVGLLEDYLANSNVDDRHLGLLMIGHDRRLEVLRLAVDDDKLEVIL